MKEEIKKMFRRIELDKSNDSCGFEFADGFSCTFDNIATCYDDRLKLYDLVKDLQSQLKAKEEVIKEAREYVNHSKKNIDESGMYVETYTKWKLVSDVLDDLLEILSKGESK